MPEPSVFFNDERDVGLKSASQIISKQVNSIVEITKIIAVIDECRLRNAENKPWIESHLELKPRLRRQEDSHRLPGGVGSARRKAGAKRDVKSHMKKELSARGGFRANAQESAGRGCECLFKTNLLRPP